MGKAKNDIFLELSMYVKTIKNSRVMGNIKCRIAVALVVQVGRNIRGETTWVMARSFLILHF